MTKQTNKHQASQHRQNQQGWQALPGDNDMLLYFLLDLGFSQACQSYHQSVVINVPIHGMELFWFARNAFQRKSLLKQVPLCHSSIEPCTSALEEETGR